MRETHGCDGCENQEAFLAPYRFAPECSQREIAANRFTSIAVVHVGKTLVLGNWLTADLAPIRAEADPRLRWSSLLIAEPEGTRYVACGVGDRGLTEQKRPLLI